MHDYSTRVSEDLFTIYLQVGLICESMHNLSNNSISKEFKIQCTIILLAEFLRILCVIIPLEFLRIRAQSLSTNRVSEESRIQ